MHHARSRFPKRGRVLRVLIALTAVTSFSLASMNTVEARDFKDVYSEVAKDLASRNPEKRSAAVERLAETGDEKAVRYIFDTMRKEWNHPSMQKMGESLRYFSNKEALEAIEKQLTRLKGSDEAFMALYGWTGVARGESAAGDAMISAALADAKSKEVFKKMAILHAIARSERSAFANTIADVLTDRERGWDDYPIIPITACYAATQISDGDARFVLATAIGKTLEDWVENERVVHFAAQAGSAVTGEKPYTDHRFYYYWAQTKGEMKEEQRKHSTNQPRPRPKFFGTEAIGKRIVFVIDVSGSMAAPVNYNPPRPEKKEEPKEEDNRRITGGKNKKKKDDKDKDDEKKQIPPPDYSKAKTKIELAKMELIYSIKQLPEEYTFNVITYSTAHRWISSSLKGFISATDQNKEKFIKEIEKLKAGGATNIHGSIRRAFMASERGEIGKEDDPALDPEVFESGAETIFFLTDGSPTHSDFSQGSVSKRQKSNAPPTRGKDPYGAGDRQTVTGAMMDMFRDNIIADFKRMNTFRRSTINTIGIGPHDRTLLQALAEDSGGTYSDFSGS